MEIFQTSFAGGLQYVSNITLGPDQYFLLKNGRNRFGKLKPTREPILNDSFPTGILQGIYAYEQKLLVIASGKVFIKDFTSETSYSVISGIQLDQEAKTIYAEFVPASSIIYERRAGSSADKAITLNTGRPVSSPSAVVIQDGSNRPIKIDLNTLQVETIQNYSAWTNSKREYMPIGKQMVWGNNNILYLVSKDGTKLYRSVSGRPLDFMVVIDANGNKLASSVDGGADAVNHAVDTDEITCIKNLNINDGSIYVGTRRNSYVVTPDYTKQIFSEPTFNNTPLFSSGCNNFSSIVDLIGDTAVVNTSGIRSFNAVLTSKNEGRNAPFSATVAALFEGITQTYTAAINFDDYALFGVNTNLGSAILVFDTLTQSFVSIDLFGIGLIRQFAVVDTGIEQKLFCRTDQNLVYELYNNDAPFATAELYTRAWMMPSMSIKPSWTAISIHDAKSDGVINITTLIDDIEEQALDQNIDAGHDFVLMDNTNCPTGISISYKITWNFNAQIQAIVGEAKEESLQSYKQKAKNYRTVLTKRSL